MKIIIGHSNMDLDCIGSMVLARYLYPDHRPVRSRLVHPMARNLYNMYQNHLGFLAAKEVEEAQVDSVVVVDTRSRQRVGEFLRRVSLEGMPVVVFDHHPADSSDIPGAVIREREVGANTTLLGMEIVNRGIQISADDATIALTGLYADTGNFTHENVRHADFRVASFCMKSGASLRLVRSFLKALQGEGQLTLFHEVLNRLVYRNCHGHMVLLSHLELDRQTGGLAAVADKVFEVETPDALFALFSFQKERSTLVVARSHKPEIDLGSLLAPFGGGGHAGAASALIRDGRGAEVLRTLEEHLLRSLAPAPTAEAVMSREPRLIPADWSLLAASRFLEEIDHTGAPVVGPDGTLKGFITLRDIMKGRRTGRMNAPVKAYMTRRVITGRPETTLREVEHLLFSNNIGHLPILRDGRVAGIVTRSDYLRVMEGRPAP